MDGIVSVFLIISACIIGQENNCNDFYFTMNEGVNQTKCFMSIPQILPVWQEEHPNYELKSAKCITKEFNGFKPKSKQGI